MSKWVTKPAEIDAFHWGHHDENDPKWLNDAIDSGMIVVHYDEPNPYCTICTREGIMRCDHGDFIILGLIGELYPCKPEAFYKKYAPSKKRSDPDGE